MFALTTLVYPCVLALLCLGCGLLVDRASGGVLSAALLITTGAAMLIAISQLSTDISGLAPATPALMAAAALGGLIAGRRRALQLLRRARGGASPALAGVVTYALCLAPVLASGRASFSSFMALSDSAVHMIGADYLIRHGQSYAHLDLRGSYGQFIDNYYAHSYPSGADTLLGGSGFLLGLPLIWAFQPFNAFVLASASGPAWLLARRVGLGGLLAFAAAVTCSVPALVYGYELVGSIKELVALSMVLTLGAMVVEHRRWLGSSPRAAIPFGLVVGAGTSALGVAFGAWALASGAVVAAAMITGTMRKRASARAYALGVSAAAAALLVAALPTWRGLGAALSIASNIASTSNAGNLPTPLRAEQALGVWLHQNYLELPVGGWLTATRALELLMLVLIAAGVVHLARLRRLMLLGWLALVLLAWLVVSLSVATWANAKTAMITSPAVILLAWAGVAGLRSCRAALVARVLASAAAFAIVGGVVASDASQYHASDLAPTARYGELEALAHRFAGRGPVLFTDFDEYSMYVLRDLDVSGPDFAYPPPALSGASAGYGRPVDIYGAPAAAVIAYPLIVTRRDPSAPRPPSAYSLAWQGSYYQVWSRVAGARAALAHVALPAGRAAQCARIGDLARAYPHAHLVAARAPTIINAVLSRKTRPRSWTRGSGGIVMRGAGTLRVRVPVPASGLWRLWLKGRFMPPVEVSVDGRRIETISGELSGNSLVAGAAPPVTVRLPRGANTIELTRGSFTLAPGDGGTSVLAAVFITRVGDGDGARELARPASAWRGLCAQPREWVEAVSG